MIVEPWGSVKSCHEVILRVEELNTQEISNLVWSAATLRFHNAPVVSSLLSESIKQIGALAWVEMFVRERHGVKRPYQSRQETCDDAFYIYKVIFHRKIHQTPCGPWLHCPNLAMVLALMQSDTWLAAL